MSSHETGILGLSHDNLSHASNDETDENDGPMGSGGPPELEGCAGQSWRDLYPFVSHFLPLSPSIRMHYVDEHEINDSIDAAALDGGECLLMVHGNPTWSFYWRNLIRNFRQSYRVIAVDHIGCGLSDKPQRYDYSLKQHTENLVQLVRHHDLQRVTLLAHDWGGAIGLGAVAAEPDRFQRMVLFNTAAFPPPFIPLRIRLCRVPWLGSLGIRGLNLFAQAALRMAVERPQSLPPAVRAGLLAPYGSWADRVAIDRFVQDIPGSSRHATFQTLDTLQARLQGLAPRPVKLIWGMKDWCFRPSCLRMLEEMFPQAETCEIDGAGHYVIEEATDQVIAEVRRFLQER